MTGAAGPAVGGACAAASWRLLDSGLWVARCDGRHLGTVQRGRRWLAADADSEPIGLYRTLAEAQAAVEHPGVRHAAAPRTGVAESLLVVAVGLLVLATTCAMVWNSTVFLL